MAGMLNYLYFIWLHHSEYSSQDLQLKSLPSYLLSIYALPHAQIQIDGIDGSTWIHSYALFSSHEFEGRLEYERSTRIRFFNLDESGIRFRKC